MKKRIYPTKKNLKICCYCGSRLFLMIERKIQRKSGSWRIVYKCRKCNADICRKYRHTPNGRKLANLAEKQKYQRYPYKFRARFKLRYAIKVGKILKPKFCDDCKLKKPLEGHHKDYSKPLEVRWLCKQCHADLHRYSSPHSLWYNL